MKQYYYSDGQERFGPFSFEELSNQPISKDTLIWHEELDDWTRAEELVELAPVFERPTLSPPLNAPNLPPVAPSNPNVLDSSAEVKPKTWLVESILVTVLCCLPFGVAAIVNAAKVDSKYATGDYVGAKKASNEAKKWTIIGLISGLVFILLYFAYFFFAVLGEFNDLDF
jgi:hypothetical protein